MRAIRTTTISILAVGLLAGSAVGVAAQDEPGPEAAALVSGELVEPGDPAFDCGSAAFEEVTGSAALTQERGRVCGGTTEMSDPRLDGVLTFMDDADRFNRTGGFSDLVWGSVTIENDDGDWEGRAVGTSDMTNDLAGLTYIELVGSGAYEGLSAVLFMLEGDGLPLSGVIVPGDLPPDR